jgi:hypothetical protein
MNMPNALGFIGVGSIMEAIQFVPGISHVRQMWLLVMGGVLIAVGFSVIAQVAWRQLSPWVLKVRQGLAQQRADARGQASAAVRRLTT